MHKRFKETLGLVSTAGDKRIQFLQQELLRHLENGEYEKAIESVTTGADINHCYSYSGSQHASILQVAASKRNPSLLSLLLKLCADPNKTFGDMPPPLFEALDSESLQVLLESKADVHVTYNGENILIHHAYRPYLFPVLLEFGLDINRSNCNGIPALHHAVQLGHMPAVKIFLRFGAKISVKTSDNTWVSALDIARSTKLKNRRPYVELLKKYAFGTRSLKLFLKRLEIKKNITGTNV